MTTAIFRCPGDVGKWPAVVAWRMPAAPIPADAIVHYQRAWLSAADADRLLELLQAQVPWETHRIRMFGRWVDSPRLSCWMGDAQARYRYSGAEFVPRPWLPAVDELRVRLQRCGLGTYNSVLLNRYRNGGDSMGWHSDDEPELGPVPRIASISLGAPRRFLLRRRNDHTCKQEYLLSHGDLLLMAGTTQKYFQHAVPKMARAGDERINLTFRWIQP